MENEKVSLEQATKEINQWLDGKKINPRKRADNEKLIETLIDGVVYGQLVFDKETNTITQHLDFPIIGDGASIDKLTFKARVQQWEVKSRIAKTKQGDSFGIIGAYIAALTGQPEAILDKLETTDFSLCQAIAVFFV